ncbi:MAG: hypothetical protein UY92_C0004G0039 [Candidatus Magasanikbacteria bacterium GW2011_GWA2_56_11]|uniref:Methyltransferase type 11 domain-containing protein n=1 Tax=Candidatus Magasanikbacteria bacterium GW2011_GWA2_56_11 TaxID=1619044 RepID=A0A0G1YH03_9BACT|nr:MAG: hypothetical protein UY92_C0004G0039 [Candidatus Magasanikbacteria bacterium GW2011_GWA2_56_11]
MLTPHEATNRRIFSRVAKRYDSPLARRVYFGRLYRHLLKILEREAGTTLGGARVLDVACGTGEIINNLARRFSGSAYTGLDITPAMLERAKKKTAGLANVSFVEATVDELPFLDGAFDLVICSEAFHHFSDPGRALSEMRRVLSLRGRLLLVDPAFNRPWIRRLANKFLPRLEHAHAVYSTGELAGLMENYGFTVEFRSTYALNSFILGAKKNSQRVSPLSPQTETDFHGPKTRSYRLRHWCRKNQSLFRLDLG